jgi:hypothetical protein
MHTAGVVRELRRCQAIGLHQIAIRVALLAGRCDVHRMDGRARIVDWKNVVDPMTVGAYGNPLVSLVPLLAMHAGVVESQLIGTKRRIESLHALAIRVARTAQLGDLRARNTPTKSIDVSFLFRFDVCVPAVAGRASHIFVAVHASGRLVDNHPQIAFELGMTLNAGVLRLFCHGAGRQHHETSQPPTEILENPHLPILITSTRIRLRSWKRGRSSRK